MSRPVLTATAGVPLPLRRAGAAPGALLSAWWLGQAGFLLETAGIRLVVDPYLSDTLAVKYQGTPFPHRRLVPPPVEPGALRDVDLVLSTHGHTDHLDPGTLGPLAEANPACRFVVPAAHAALAASRGVPPDRLVPASAFAGLAVAGVELWPLPSAHEDLAVDGQGQHLFLGFLLQLAGATVYHSGDCVPYPDLAGHLRRQEVDLALLPVNGRDPRRLSGGVPGNFTLDEAMELAGAASLRAVVGHHFGLFDFNTIDPQAARARIADHPELPPFLLSELSVRYDLRAPARRTAEGRGTIAP